MKSLIGSGSIWLLLSIMGCSQAPTEKPPVLSGYESTPMGCRDLATGLYAPSSKCDPKAAP